SSSRTSLPTGSRCSACTAAYRCREEAAPTAECFPTRSASAAGRSRDSLPATRCAVVQPLWCEVCDIGDCLCSGPQTGVLPDEITDVLGIPREVAEARLDDGHGLRGRWSSAGALVSVSQLSKGLASFRIIYQLHWILSEDGEDSRLCLAS